MQGLWRKCGTMEDVTWSSPGSHESGVEMAEKSKAASLINRSCEVVVSTLLVWAIGSFTCIPKCGSMKGDWRTFNQILHHALYSRTAMFGTGAVHGKLLQISKGSIWSFDSWPSFTAFLQHWKHCSSTFAPLIHRLSLQHFYSNFYSTGNTATSRLTFLASVAVFMRQKDTNKDNVLWTECAGFSVEKPLIIARRIQKSSNWARYRRRRHC